MNWLRKGPDKHQNWYKGGGRILYSREETSPPFLTVVRCYIGSKIIGTNKLLY